MVYILFSRCASYNMGEGVAVEAATESQLITGRRNKNEEKNLIFVDFFWLLVLFFLSILVPYYFFPAVQQLWYYLLWFFIIGLVHLCDLCGGELLVWDDLAVTVGETHCRNHHCHLLNWWQDQDQDHHNTFSLAKVWLHISSQKTIPSFLILNTWSTWFKRSVNTNYRCQWFSPIFLIFADQVESRRNEFHSPKSFSRKRISG